MQPTRHLYEISPGDLCFEAEVLACEEKNGHYEAVLNQSAFFPEGGGQPADNGLLGEAQVSDAHERGGVIFHTVSKPLEVGTTVRGQVDAARRLDHSQQHTGEHIFSGLLCATHDAANVGFHIGADSVTVDFNRPLTLEETRAIERRANEAIWRDIPVICEYPDAQTLAQMNYRSKKALEGPVRIVHIEGVDTCACCGTHMASTGGVGQIKILDYLHYKGGIRLTLACGRRALAATNRLLDEAGQLSHQLSAPVGALGTSLERVLKERDALKAERDRLSGLLFAQAAAQVAGEDVRIVLGDMLQGATLRKAAGTLAEGARLGAVLLPDGEGWQFALSSAVLDTRPACRALCAAFGGKGGGPADMTQGRLSHGSFEALCVCIRETLLQP